MTALPAAADFTGSTINEAQFKTATTNLLLFLAGLLGSDGAAVTALSTLGALGGKVAAKTGAYTVLAADRGTVFHCSGTWTLTLTAAATLATGHSFAVINTGSGIITIDPNASELIDGATTKALNVGESCVVTCSGTGFHAISGAGGGFPSGTRMVFQQTSAPTGWTKDTTAALNDSIMRIVTGTASSGGSIAFSTFNGQSATGATTLSTAQMPAHTHLESMRTPGGENSGSYSPSAGDASLGALSSTASAGGGGSHTHALTHSIKYYDFIIASKN